MPVIPAILFGVMSKKVTTTAAAVSVLVGAVLAAIFGADQLMGVEAGRQFFPWLHTKLTLNYTYRGLWGTIATIIVLFTVSGFTKKTAADKLAKTTIDWKKKIEKFDGFSDWRLQLAALTGITILLYAWLW